MIVKCFTVGPLSTNCYLAACEETGGAVVIDPGGMSAGLASAIREHEVSHILLTHGHFDHILETAAVADMTGAAVAIHDLDAPMLTDPVMNGSFMIGGRIQAPEASTLLSGGDTVAVGKSSLTVVHTPGHSPGGISFLFGDEFIIGGDTLFRLSVGRWDFPGGDYDTLMKSLGETFAALPDGMVLYPGHGESSTIGFEKTHNEFLRQMS